MPDFNTFQDFKNLDPQYSDPQFLDRILEQRDRRVSNDRSSVLATDFVFGALPGAQSISEGTIKASRSPDDPTGPSLNHEGLTRGTEFSDKALSFGARTIGAITSPINIASQSMMFGTSLLRNMLTAGAIEGVAEGGLEATAALAMGESAGESAKIGLYAGAAGGLGGAAGELLGAGIKAVKDIRGAEGLFQAEVIKQAGEMLGEVKLTELISPRLSEAGHAADLGTLPKSIQGLLDQELRAAIVAGKAAATGLGEGIGRVRVLDKVTIMEKALFDRGLGELPENLLKQDFGALGKILNRPGYWANPKVKGVIQQLFNFSPKGQAALDKELIGSVKLTTGEVVELSTQETYQALVRRPDGKVTSRSLTPTQVKEAGAAGTLESLSLTGRDAATVPPGLADAFYKSQLKEIQYLDPGLDRGRVSRAWDKLRPIFHFSQFGPKHKNFVHVIQNADALGQRMSRGKNAPAAKLWLEIDMEFRVLRKKYGAEKLNRWMSDAHGFDAKRKNILKAKLPDMPSDVRKALENIYKARDMARSAGDNAALTRMNRSPDAPDGAYVLESVEQIKENLESAKAMGRPSDVSLWEGKLKEAKGVEDAMKERQAQLDASPGWLPHSREGKFIVVGYEGNKVLGKLPGDKSTIKHTSAWKTIGLAEKEAERISKLGFQTTVSTKVDYIAGQAKEMGVEDLDKLIFKMGEDVYAKKWAALRKMAQQNSGAVKERTYVQGFDSDWQSTIQGLQREWNSSVSKYQRAYLEKFGGEAIRKLPRSDQGYAKEVLDAVMHPDGDSLYVVRRLMPLMHLALKPAYFVRNLTQTMTHGLGAIGERLGEGKGFVGGVMVQPKVLALRIKSYRQASKAMAQAVAGKKITGVDAKLWSKAQEEGVLGSQVLNPGENLVTSNFKVAEGQTVRTLKKAHSAAGFFITASDKANRYADFAAGLLTGKNRGLKGTQLFEHARDFVHETQIVYSGWNRPLAVAKGGQITAIGRLWATYRTYTLNSWSMMAKRYGKRGNWGGRISGTAGLMAVGGTFAIPGTVLMMNIAKSLGVDLEGKLRNWLAGVSDKDAMETYMDAGEHANGMSKSLFQQAREFGADLIVGGPGYVAGVDTPGWMGLGSLPISDYDEDEFLGILSSVPKGLLKSYDRFRKGNVSEGFEALPFRTAAGIAKALRWSKEGKALSPSGKIIVDEKGKPWKPTGFELALKGMGFPLRSEGRHYDRGGRERGDTQQRTDRNSIWNQAFAKAARIQDPALKKETQDALAKAVATHNALMRRKGTLHLIISPNAEAIEQLVKASYVQNAIPENELAPRALVGRGTK